MKEDIKFYVGQKAFIKKGEEVLILHMKRGLRYPGGKIQEGETDLAESLKREVREETGLEVSVGDPFTTWTFVFPEGHRLAGSDLFLVGYKCEYISGEVVLNEEHDAFTWVNKDNYKKVDNGDKAFKALEKYFLD